jgi:hypothetical protein
MVLNVASTHIGDFATIRSEGRRVEKRKKNKEEQTEKKID